MTREEVEKLCEQISEWTKFSSRPIHHTTLRILAHDADQRNIIDEQVEENRGLRADVKLMQQENLAGRQEIERLRAELDHWTYELFKHRESMLRKALQGILDIGKRDMTSPKYDGYFEAARQALKEDS